MHTLDWKLDCWTNYLENNSLLQPLWGNLRLNYSGYLRSPLFPIILTSSSYFVFCLPFLICDIMGERWPWVLRHKIQPGRRPAASALLHCGRVTLYNHVFLVLPASVAQWAWRPPVDLPNRAPSLLDLLAGVTGNLLLFDFQYFIWHLLHHRIRWLYVTFHAIHHKYPSPFALATQCLGGWELVTVSIWTTLNPVVLRCHLLTTWAFMVSHVYVSVEDHCGYDFPWYHLASTEARVNMTCTIRDPTLTLLHTSVTGTKSVVRTLTSASPLPEMRVHLTALR